MKAFFCKYFFVSYYTRMSNPSQLCGTAQVRYSVHVFAYMGLQTEEYQASEEIQIRTITQKVADRHTDESTL